MHKRQISEAIPRDERPNAPNDAPNKAPVAAPQQAQQAAQDAPEESTGTRKSGKGPQAKEAQLMCNCKTQLQCNRCQIAAVSHSCDGHSFNAKCLIPSSYPASHCP